MVAHDRESQSLAYIEGLLARFCHLGGAKSFVFLEQFFHVQPVFQ
jgi:hypothetical protein